MSLRRLFAIVQKELRQMRRDRITLAMIVGIPVMQLVLFGYAITLNLRGLDAAIADQAGTAGSRAVNGIDNYTFPNLRTFTLSLGTRF